ncbi:uncharacterized protein LOC127873697 isoform X3 [Dreissena polymorpha]|uniref:uncharacterized protein LOC127873697 isoform X3 n=1 Tax=Dreissena polymorpha TaxID=45954 RepID=UPI002263F34C|nr:uncharacterized protein LOC127873697 isoform X3 [Dreissena polymorpha]
MKTRLECKRLKLKKPGTNSTENVSDPAMRSPQRLKTPKPRRVGQQFVETPGRDELIFSQHFDSQALVGWDCNSPDVLRRISKETDGSDVTDLLKLIGNDDECVDEARPSNRSTPPLLGVWREGGGGEPNNNNSSNIPSRQHRKGRFRKRSGKDSAVSRDLFEKLSLELEKCTEVTHETEEVAEKNQEEGMQPAALNQCSEDLFDDDDDHMLLSDDGLTEPQVLALLDEVEFQATQQLSRQSKAVSSKTSNQGIEIDAGEPTNQDQGYGSSQEFPNSQGGINNSQGGNTNSQEKNSYNQGVNSNSQGHVGEGVTSNSQSGANGNDGVRSTQTKYSPAEIEKKKQLALQKRLQRQNVHS